jgi:hypothetical protein
MKKTFLPYVALLTCVLSFAQSRGDDTLRLREPLPIGARYQVQIRVQLQGTLTVPGEKDKPEPKPLPLTGESAIDYDERVLSVDRDGKVNRAVRINRRIDFERQLGPTPQKATLRPTVRRIVQGRLNGSKLAFSPDGPLTWGETDLLRTDVFTPALLGLLPEREVRVGDRWKASLEAIRELTDFEHVDDGGLDCRLERIILVDRRRQARVSLLGTVRGTNEDGQARQQLDGFLTFDLDGGYLAALTINGKHTLLNGDGKEVGKVEGRFVMTRQPNPRAPELSDESLRGITLEPNDSNTRLIYENDDLKVSFLYPRRWRVSGVQGRQVTLDSADGGNGLLMTIDSPQRVPTGDQFLAETRAWLEKQKGKIGRIVPPYRVQAAPLSLERFVIEAEMMGQKFVMDYHIARQAAGGATIAARLQPTNVAAVQREVEEIARSVRLR